MSLKNPDNPGVFVLGSTNIDLICRTEALPLPGETVLGGDVLQAFGGKGANQAVAAARAGARVAFATCLGTDAFGDGAFEAFETEGILTQHVRRSDQHPTGVALITIDRKGENCIVVAPGANHALRPDGVDSSGLEGHRIFVAQLEVPIDTVSHGLTLARDRGLITVLDPAPARPLERDLLSLVDCLTPNAAETETLTGVRPATVGDCERAAQRLRKSGVGCVIVTLGAMGAVLVDQEGTLHQPAPEVDAIDTTASGDAFTGGLAAGLASGLTLREALPGAVAGGALAATVEGAQPAMPDREAIERCLSSGPFQPGH